MIGKYFSASNAIDNHNRTRQYGGALEKYWATHSVYFRLTTTVVFGMGITDGKILFFHVISEQSKENNISVREYKNRTIYY